MNIIGEPTSGVILTAGNWAPAGTGRCRKEAAASTITMVNRSSQPLPLVPVSLPLLAFIIVFGIIAVIQEVRRRRKHS